MKQLGVLLAAAGIAVAAPAAATVYQFDITGDYAVSFQIDASPSPDDYYPGDAFIIWDVSVPDTLFGVADIAFFTSLVGGGLSIEDFYAGESLFVADGPTLFEGTVEAPTFKLGTFALTEYEGSDTYSLTISEIGTAVPEPASWAMLIAGFGLVGGAMRRRHTQVRFAG